MKLWTWVGTGALVALACGSPTLRPDAGTGGGTGGGLGGGAGGGSGNTAACAMSCSGCCDATGTCITGLSAAKCGVAGSACVACPSGQSCDFSGQCKLPGCGSCVKADGSCPTSVTDTACGNQGYACVSCASLGATCDAVAGKCTGGVCGGCRNGLGVCQQGGTRANCGTGGAACQTCGDGQLCTNGACVSADAGAGGGGGGGGGTVDAGTSCPSDTSTELPLPAGAISFVRVLPSASGWTLAWKRDAAIELGRLDANGTFVAGSVKTVAALGNYEISSLALAASGNGVLVAYAAGSSQNSRQGFLVRLDSAGAVLGTTNLPNPTGKQDQVSVVWNPLDSQWGVVWREGVFSPVTKFARYDAMGVAVGSPTTPVAGLMSSNPMVWTGQGYAAATTYAGQTLLNLIDRQGAVTASPEIVPMAGFPNQVALGFSGTELGVTFMDDSRGGMWTNPHMRFARFTAAGAAIGSDFPISAPPTALELPGPGNPAWDGTQFAATWNEKVGGLSRVFRALMGATGVVTGTTVQVSCSVSEDDFGASVQASGTKRAVVFLRGQRARIAVF